MCGGGFFHLRFELRLQVAALAFEEIACGLDLFEILPTRDDADAGGGAIFKMGVKTMLVVRFARREDAAAAQVELFPGERDSVAQRGGIHERSKVTRAVVFFEPREDKIGNRVAQVDLEHQIALVVAQADVEARF